LQNQNKCVYLYQQKQTDMKTLVKDSQSRIVRYGMKCFRNDGGYKVQAFANAKKSGNKLIISDVYNDCFDSEGNIVSGTYKIISVGVGKIAEIKCEKI